jgi:phosphoglycerol transferase MdoB-like AlkP superfamily enzyme
MLVRQHVSDEYNYKLLIDDFEKRDKKFPYFAFNVTMQNHGGYTTQADNFNQNIYVTSSEKEYPKVNQYLSLVKKSDTAFKKLIKYFEKVEEPTVICMFGDHQPNVEPEFISELLGVKSLSSLTTEQEQKRHITPFFIWANYDIKEKNIKRISANYLSSLVLKTAGVKLTDYNEYLLNLRKTLPVINSVGYIDKEGECYKWSDVSPYTELLSKYEQIQYNGIFDKENLKTETFFIEGYTHEATELEEKESGEKQE